MHYYKKEKVKRCCKYCELSSFHENKSYFLFGRSTNCKMSSTGLHVNREITAANLGHHRRRSKLGVMNNTYSTNTHIL